MEKGAGRAEGLLIECLVRFGSLGLASGFLNTVRWHVSLNLINEVGEACVGHDD
jgi:hypothetical protein